MPETLKIDGKMNIHIISPTRTVLDDVADKVLLPAINGDVMILYDRAPIFLATRPGCLWFYNKGQKPVCYLISDGICEIRRNICSVLAWGVKSDEIDKDKIHFQLQETKKELGKMTTEHQKKFLLKRVDFLQLLLNRPSLLVPPAF